MSRKHRCKHCGKESGISWTSIGGLLAFELVAIFGPVFAVATYFGACS